MPMNSAMARRIACLIVSSRSRGGSVLASAASANGSFGFDQWGIRQHGVDLPSSICAGNPDLVLERVAAGDAVLDFGGEALGHEPAGCRNHFRR